MFLEAMMNIGASSIFVLPMIPKILDIIRPLSNPRPSIYILENEMFIDRETYYWLYYFWDVVSIMTNSFVSVSVDTMFIICIEHCCALYDIIRWVRFFFLISTTYIILLEPLLWGKLSLTLTILFFYYFLLLIIVIL